MTARIHCAGILYVRDASKIRGSQRAIRAEGDIACSCAKADGFAGFKIASLITRSTAISGADGERAGVRIWCNAPIKAKVAPPNSKRRTKFRVGSRAGMAVARVRKAIAELTSGFLSDKTDSF